MTQLRAVATTTAKERKKLVISPKCIRQIETGDGIGNPCRRWEAVVWIPGICVRRWSPWTREGADDGGGGADDALLKL